MVNGISGCTKICGVFGCPVGHTLSPIMHNAAFTATGLRYVYVPFEVAPYTLPAAVEGIRALGMAGVNLTVPHKEAVLPLLDGISDEAAHIGAVNTIINREGYLYGENTDGKGYLKALREAGFVPAGRTVLFLGAGGSARAVAVQLALAGAGKLVFANRTEARAAQLAQFVTDRTGTVTDLAPWPERPGDQVLAQVLAEADLVVQTTSLGMSPNVYETVPLPFANFRPGQVASDLVYNPPETLFLKKARLGGAVTVSGLGMLLHQGALAFELWTGVPAPLEAMREALQRKLFNR
ncbi:MAG: shikimate dehydrogenase [Peptococcaceae bacterium]|nr:shikimate dehydrogenase [Candidatus Syntrophopropionicum ammoniitolerans]